MANTDHLKHLKKGVRSWNDWRTKEPLVNPDLIGANLRGAELAGANFAGADIAKSNLSGANLGGADLGGADLADANLAKANLREADLADANLGGADLPRADLARANLAGANLSRANLAKANLTSANLLRVNLAKANLAGADLAQANLGGSDLAEAKLYGASLLRANLANANLAGANLVQANLAGANLGKAELGRADLGGADLAGADLAGADLKLANLIDTRLDRANLTGTCLWETQRSNWSIKDVVCHAAFWDRKSEEQTEYGEREFERVFAERPRIVVRYPGGISPMDLLTLPLIVERLQQEYPASVLQIRSVESDGGGASVTIIVEDLQGRTAEAFAAEVTALRGDLLAIQERLRSEENLRLTIEGKYQAVVRDVLPLLLERAIPKQEINIGRLTAPIIIEGNAMHKGDTYNVHGQAGVIGPGGHGHDITLQQFHGSLDLLKLAEELARLRDVMKEKATGTREQNAEIGAVTGAEEAAARHDTTAVLRYLKSAGTWTLGIAEKIGVAVATDALKKAMSVGP